MTIARRTLTSRHGVPFFVSAVLMAVAIGTGILAVNRVRNAYNWVGHTYNVIVQTNRCAALIRFAETEQRGYIITGKDSFLESFKASADALTLSLDQLTELVRDSESQRQRVKTMRGLIEYRLNDLESAAALGVIGQDERVELVLAIRDAADGITAEEYRLLDQRQGQMNRELIYAILTSCITGFLALAMGGHTFWVMRRALRALAREEGLLEAKEHAEQSDREKSEFLANMSHEIRTPMNAVLGFADLLQNQVTTPKQHQYVDAINTSGRALLTIINDILDLSRIEAGRIELNLKPTSIRTLFGGVRTIFSQQAMERGVSLDFHVEENVPPALMFDGARLRQIIFNTVGNSLKFTKKGSVTVTARAHLAAGDETAVALFITVADTGIGIARKYWDSIFEPFQQVGEGLNRRHGGTGLGLSITRRLTEILSGKIQLESEPGKGTEIRFSFPKVAISSALPDEEKNSHPDENFNGLQASLILVVDDVPLNRELVICYLEGSHHRLIQAGSGREAVEKAKKFMPDIVLMDIRMPDLDGEGALEEIRADETLANLPVIAVTASSMLGEERELRTIFDGYIRKPFSHSVLFRELALFLPQADVTGKAEELPTIAVAEWEAGDRMAWASMITKLRHLEGETWAGLVGTLGVRESNAFATELLELAAHASCQPLDAFARRIIGATETFDINILEETMQAYPSLVDRLAAVQFPNQ